MQATGRIPVACLFCGTDVLVTGASEHGEGCIVGTICNGTYQSLSSGRFSY